jgi:hypothetical protein
MRQSLCSRELAEKDMTCREACKSVSPILHPLKVQEALMTIYLELDANE